VRKILLGIIIHALESRLTVQKVTVTFGTVTNYKCQIFDLACDNSDGSCE